MVMMVVTVVVGIMLLDVGVDGGCDYDNDNDDNDGVCSGYSGGSDKAMPARCSCSS